MKERYETDATFKEMVDRSKIELSQGRNPSTQEVEVLAYARVLIDAEKLAQWYARQTK